MRSVYIKHQDAFIRCHEAPSNKAPLVYLPAISFSVSASFFDVVMHPKIPEHRALLVDYFGSGVSDHPRNFGYTMEEHVNAVAALLDDAGCQGATIVGHSMGGTVAVKLALARPDLVGKLVIGEGNVTSGGGALVRQIISHEEADFVDTVFPKMLAGIFDDAKSGDPIGLRRNNVWKNISPLGLYRNAQALYGVPDTLLDDFLSLSIPTTFVYGGNSLPTTPQDAGADTPWPDYLIASEVNIEVVPNAGHGLMFDNLDGFVEVLLRAAF